jgi:redox-sensitive bicupin YhaK (pirin superfamily)
MPPQTPPIHRSVVLRRKALNPATNGTLDCAVVDDADAEPPCVPIIRALARANSSSVNTPRWCSSPNFSSSSLIDIAYSLRFHGASRPCLLNRLCAIARSTPPPSGPMPDLRSRRQLQAGGIHAKLLPDWHGPPEQERQTMRESANANDSHCTEARDCAVVQRVIQPHDKDLGGFSVRRSLPAIGHRSVGPWVFFDHFGPAVLPVGAGVVVRPHPHIGLATVTYLFEGEMLHRDSLGNVQAIRPGDINLMVAGRGIVHSERERPEAITQPRALHGLQLWLALPQADEETDPTFQHYPGADSPAPSVDGVPVRVMMGSAYGATSPVKVFAQTLYVEAELQAGQRLLLPDARQRAVYVAQGGVRVGNTDIAEHTMAALRDDYTGAVVLEARLPSRVAIIGGEHLGTRHIDWNFVSSSKQRIAQAKDDWAQRRFPTVPGDDIEFIPLPT